MRNNLLFRHWAGIICLMCAVIFNVQYVAATNVSGTTYASNLVANDNIVLTGNTVLFMNTDLTLTGISGDYTLEIQGSNTLTVNNPNGNAISVSSLNTISASLDITGSKDGLNVDQDITISGGSLVVHAGVDGVYSRNGSITMNGTFNLTSTNGRAIYARIGNVAITGDITASTSSSRMSAIEAGLADNSGFAPGNITITGSTVNVSAVNVAIHAYAGSVSVTGDATVTSSNEAAIQTTSIAGFGETFKSDVTLDGTFHLEGAPYAVVSGGKLMLKTGGSITSVGTLYALEAMTLNGDVDVDGRNAQAICCRWGDISITGNLIAKSASTSEPCVQAGFADNTGFASGGVIIFGGTVNIDAVADAIKTHADGGINISGNVTVKSKKGAALFAMAIDLTNFNDKFYSGDITLAGTINLSGGKYGIVSGGGDITLQSGSLTSVGALYALSDITINGDLNAKTTRPDVPCIQAGNADNTGFYEGNVTITGNNIIVSSVTDAIKSHARGNIRISGNANVYSLKGAAIYAFAIDFFGELYAGNVTLDGTIKLNGGQYGIVSGGGDITLQSGSLTSVGALYAMSDITINGDLNVKTELADRPCIQAGSTTNTGFVIGNITINGETILVNSEHDAIKAIGGNIRLTGNATVASSNGAAIFAFGIEAFGESYKGDVIFGTGEYNISGKEYSIVSHGAITLSSALKIVSPTNGTISGYTIVDSNSETAKFVHISAPAVSGSVALTSEPAPGDYVSFTLTGDVAMTVISQVWQISDDGSVWSDIEEDEPAGAPARDGVRKARKIATDSYYVPKQSEIGKYLRVQVKSEGHIGYLYSPVRRIAKFICTKVPETPTLSISDNKVVVDNAKKIQEYIIFNVQRDPADLVESDWANAVSPASNGSLELTGVQNSLNCVYTRVKETSTTQAGTDVEWAPIYNGTATALTAIKLSLDDRTQYFDIQGNELNCALGDVIRITAAPVPSNATGWVGVQGSKWLVNGVYSGSPYGTFYANEACTTPLNASSYYSTVYFKTQQQKSCVELRAEVTGASGTIYRAQAINIGDANGDVLLDHVTVAPQTIGSGEYLSGIRFYQYPKSAALENLTAETSGTYRVPLISFNVSTGKMIIDARNADQGDYTYTLKRNGETIPDQFTVSVTKGKYDVDSIRIRTKYITADPGEVVEIIPLLYPASSEAEILWYTTDEVNGPVSNGKVTIANDAPIGTEIFITAIAMGRYDNCKITVSGEEYGLYVASTQVTSRNRDDILGDGKFSFDGLRTLTINGDVTLNTPVRLVQNTGIEDLLINIADTCVVTQQTGVNSVIFDLHKDTRITGKLLSITGNTVGINVTDNSTLTLDSANLYVYAQYPLTGDIGGNDSLSIVASRVEIRAKGSAAVDDFNGGISLTDCYIQTPTGGEVVDATIEDGNGSQVRNLLIVPHKEKRVAWMAFLPLEVNVTEGDELEEPTLLNPEQLSVTYSSSDPSVATVDALTGDVTLVAAGTTTITATFAGDEKYLPSEASYVLTVEPSGDPTAIEDVRFESDKAQKILHEGMLYIIRPDGKVVNVLGQPVR